MFEFPIPAVSRDNKAPLWFAVLLLCTPASLTFAHDPDSASPKWCGDLGDGLPQGKEVPGQFPGPKEHYRMNNQEIGGFEMDREIPGFSGRDFRVRFWLMEPEGLIAEHCHEDRPAYVYILSGRVVETYMDENGTPQRRRLKVGDAIPEGNGTHHWWKNDGDENVTMVAIDFPNHIVPAPQGVVKNALDDGVSRSDLAEMDMARQYPHISAMSGYKLKGRLLKVEQGGAVRLEHHYGHPGMVYVIKGTLLEHRSDGNGSPVVRRNNDLSLTYDGVWNYWQNRGDGDAELLVVSFEKEED